MSDRSIDNKRITKNTLFLYFRMLLTVVVGLYTSRVVLNVLGVSDYGVYNVVGGFVNMLAFLNLGMAGASQRFMSFEIGTGDKGNMHQVFCTSVSVHLIIALIIFVIVELIGIWALNCKLNIPPDRLNAANWVLQFSTLTFVASVLCVPFNSSIIAHEHMDAYAYISIIEIMLKLGVALCIQFVSVDLLILYSILIFLSQTFICALYRLYCKRKFEECHYHFYADKGMLKRMFSFAGWNMVGHLGFSFKDQGVNIVLNLFLGPAINAARGIAIQVNGIVNSFASNFSMAMNPQIIKLYAAGNVGESLKLAYSGVRITCYLLSIAAIPIILNADYLLELWLGVVPAYTKEFLIIILLNSCINSMSHTITTAIYAHGKVKLFQTSLAILLLSEIPMAYLILKFGGSPYEAIIPSLFTVSMSLFLRILILKKYVPSCSIKEYVFSCMGRCVFVFAIGYYLSYMVHVLLNAHNIIITIADVLLSFIIICSCIFVFGLKQSERNFVISKSVNILFRRFV